jgi:hypothetical protein
MILAALVFAATPVSVVVMSNPADRADARRVQSFVQEKLEPSTVPLTVTIDFYGITNPKWLPPSDTLRGTSPQLVLLAFTIADASGTVQHSEWVRYYPVQSRLEALHGAADIIVKRFAAVSKDGHS